MLAKELFNGNIRSMTVAIKKFGNAQGNVYGYDQLNRIRSMDVWNSTTAGAAPSTWTLKTNYRERISYDANGNIKTYTRNQQAGTLMDNLTYQYYTGTNRLQRINDAVATGTFTTDIDDQPTAVNAGNNYIYDGVGNLVKDTSEALNVVWSPYGKVLSAVRKRSTPAVDIQTLYGYDPMQNRVLKTYITGTDTTKTYYIRDAQGNTLAVYTRRKDTLVWSEQHLFGSSRLGIWEANQRLTPSVDTAKKGQIREGQRRYELTNHLGNVLVTLNDRKQGYNFTAGSYTYFEATVIQATDYYPFGLEMPGRTFQAANTSAYRFGFQNQEKNREFNEIYSFDLRAYSALIGRFWSLDPKHKQFPWNSPYCFSENRVIDAIELEGGEKLKVAILSEPTPNTSGSAILEIKLEYQIITTGRGAVSSNVNPKDFHDTYAKGNTTVYMTSLPTTNTEGTLLRGKYARWARKAENGSAKYRDMLAKREIQYYKVEINYNYTAQNTTTLEKGIEWAGKDPNGRGVVMDYALPKPGDEIEIVKINSLASMAFKNNDVGAIATNETHGFKKNIVVLNPKTTMKLNATKRAAHEAGHNSAKPHIHRTGNYEYDQTGLQSNDGNRIYPTIENTENIINDKTNRSTTNSISAPQILQQSNKKKI